MRVRIFDGIRLIEYLQVVCVDGAPTDQSIKVENFIPIWSAEQHNRHCFTRLLRLNQCQHFEELVHCAKAARKDNQGLRKIDKPEFAHEEIVEVENQLRGYITIYTLLVWQLNIHAHRLATGKGGSTIGGLHHPARATGTDDEVTIARQGLGPHRQSPG